jgi:hypothetical protein
VLATFLCPTGYFTVSAFKHYVWEVTKETQGIMDNKSFFGFPPKGLDLEKLEDRWKEEAQGFSLMKENHDLQDRLRYMLDILESVSMEESLGRAWGTKKWGGVMTE